MQELSAKPNKIIMIVGIVGSGKSSVGRYLAKHYGLPFVDSDAEVEKAAGCSVKDFFELYGEDEFRACEKRVLRRLLNGEACVLSSGGGSYLNEETRALAKEKAVTVWLKAGANVLFSRLKGRKRRPNVPSNPDDLKEAINTWMEKDEPIYAGADVVIQSREENAAATAERVIAAIDEML